MAGKGNISELHAEREFSILRKIMYFQTFLCVGTPFCDALSAHVVVDISK
jgi:hypothetical protein